MLQKVEKFLDQNWETFEMYIFEINAPPRDGFKEKKIMEFSIKGPDPASQLLNEKKNRIKHGLKML